MKSVPRLAKEPQELAAYRAANPTDAAASGAEAGAAWNRFRDDPCYKTLRAELVTAQQGLCAYCEQRLTTDKGVLHANDQQIEHVLPKSGAASRTLDWTNFMLCCGGGTFRTNDPTYADPIRHYRGEENVSCGQKKDDRELPADCDPRNFPCVPGLVSVSIDGTLAVNAAACSAAGVAASSLSETINVLLNLNCDRLKLPRSKVADNILKWVVPMLKALLDETHLTTEQRQAFHWLLISGRLQKDTVGHLRPFWTTERTFLEPDASTWITQNTNSCGCPAQAATQSAP